MIFADLEFGDLLKGALILLFVLSSIFGPMIERFARKKREEEARRKAQERNEPAPAAEEEVVVLEESSDVPPAKLPYEEIAEELFGEYIERKKKEYEGKRKAKKAVAVPEEPDVQEAPVPRFRPRIPEPEPVPVLTHVQTLETPVPSATIAPPPRAEETHLPSTSLEDRIFRGRNLSPVARALIYAEIFARRPAPRW